MRKWLDSAYRELMLGAMVLELLMLGWIAWHSK